MRISWAVIVTFAAKRNASTSNSPSASTNFIRLIEARLHALSLMKLNSLHGLVAYCRALFETGFQSLMVVSYWMPGSPQRWAASAIRRKMSRALYVPAGWPSETSWVCHSASRSTAFMNSSVTRTLWLAFWKNTEPYASPVNEAS